MAKAASELGKKRTRSPTELPCRIHASSYSRASFCAKDRHPPGPRRLRLGATPRAWSHWDAPYLSLSKSPLPRLRSLDRSTARCAPAPRLHPRCAPHLRPCRHLPHAQRERLKEQSREVASKVGELSAEAAETVRENAGGPGRRRHREDAETGRWRARGG